MRLANIPVRTFANRSAFYLGSALVALSATPAAYAQGAADQQAVQPGRGLEEIVVTATKKEESVQDVPIAVTAISGEEVREFGFSSAIDIVAQAPNVTASSAYGPGSSANVVIRGIGQNDFGEGHEAPVTTYIDEAYIVSVPAVDFSLFDIDRVEVLRGPQGTVFGRNSTGGLIQYVTAKPTFDTTGFFSATYARFNELKLEAAMGGPVNDKIAARVSALYHNSDGYIKNITPGQPDGGQAGTVAARAQLLFEPTDTLNVLVKAEYAHIDKVHAYYETVPLSAPDPVTGLYGLDPDGVDGAGYNEKNFGAGDANVTTANLDTYLKNTGYNFLGRIEKDFGNIQLISISSYHKLDREMTEDCDASINNICFAEFPYQTDWFSQELRLEGQSDLLNWTAGGYYLTQDAANQPRATFNIPVSGPTAVDPTTGLYNGAFFPIELAANWTQELESYSLFGNVEFSLTPELVAIAGVRYTRDKKDFTDADNATLRTCVGGGTNCFLVEDGGVGTANPVSLSRAEDLWSWKVGLNYTPIEDILLYASVSRGTKAGGFNNGFYGGDIAADQSLIEFEDEKNTAYEIGVKSTVLDGRLRLNAAAFYYDYKDYQTFNWVGFGGQITNSDSTVKGFEVEVDALLTEGLLVKAGMSYLDTNIEDVRGRNNNYVADRNMAFAPEFTANGAVSYDFPLGSTVEARVVWDFNYSGSRYGNNFDEPGAKIDSYFRHNATVIVDLNEQISVSGFVKNISDKTILHRNFTFSDLGYMQLLYEQPRTYGGTVTFKF